MVFTTELSSDRHFGEKWQGLGYEGETSVTRGGTLLKSYLRSIFVFNL